MYKRQIITGNTFGQSAQARAGISGCSSAQDTGQPETQNLVDTRILHHLIVLMITFFFSQHLYIETVSVLSVVVRNTGITFKARGLH